MILISNRYTALPFQPYVLCNMVSGEEVLIFKENNDENIIIVDMRGGDGGELHQLWQ
mgnify:CR=1 FL=1